MSLFSDDIEDVLLVVSFILAAIFISLFILLWWQKKNKDLDYGLLEEKIEYLVQFKDKPSLTFESEKLLKSVPIYGPDTLLNKYCIVTFDANHLSLVNSLVQDCFEGRKRRKSFEKDNFVVKQSHDITKIPSCQVILLFIEKNKDDRILEMPGSGGDDLKLLTVKSCRKMKSDVFVIYFGDEDSETLMPGLLYNPQIAAVTEHPELKELERFDRVITCCRKRFTTTQREKIAESIV